MNILVLVWNDRVLKNAVICVKDASIIATFRWVWISQEPFPCVLLELLLTAWLRKVLSSVLTISPSLMWKDGSSLLAKLPQFSFQLPKFELPLSTQRHSPWIFISSWRIIYTVCLSSHVHQERTILLPQFGFDPRTYVVLLFCYPSFLLNNISAAKFMCQNFSSEKFAPVLGMVPAFES